MSEAGNGFYACQLYDVSVQAVLHRLGKPVTQAPVREWDCGRKEG